MADPREAAAEPRPAEPRSFLVRAGLFSGLTIFACVLTSLYVASENGYYYWDYAVYQNLAIGTALAFQGSMHEGARALAHFAREDYNAFFALPLVPIIRAFGETRLSYELALTLVYVLPFALALGSIGAALIRGPRRAVFWSTAAVALLTPMTWVPGLRGYPDVGAALLVALAIRLCIADTALHRPSSIVGIGLLLGAAAIYRRHFLFAAPALLATVALFALVDEGRALRTSARQALFRSAAALLRTFLAGAVAVALVMLVARPVAARLMAHDFYSLYKGYLMPAGMVASWFAQPYGWLACAFALGGFAVGAWAGVVAPRPAAFLVAFTTLSYLQWVLVVRQIGEQYTLHFTPVFVLGLAAFGWTLWLRATGTLHALVPYAAQAYLAANLVCGLGGLDLVASRVALRSLLAANWPPLTRVDQREIGALVDTLRNLSRPADPILVVASSPALNPDLLVNAERARYSYRAARLNVLNAPSVDSRDQYPLEALKQAELVVLGHPLQVHLGEEQQKVLAVAYDLFMYNLGMARDFTRLPKPFYPYLRQDVTAYVYRRDHPSSPAAVVATLRFFESRFPNPPGLQPAWTVVSGRFPSWVRRQPDGSSWITWHPGPPDQEPATLALYLPDPPAPVVHLRGTVEFVDRRCEGARLVLAYVMADGKTMDVAEVSRHPGEPGDFEVSFPYRDEDLTMRLTSAPGQRSIDYCLLHLRSLVVR